MRGITKIKREINMNNIIFFILLDTKQKVISRFNEL